MTVVPGRVSVLVNNHDYGRFVGAAVDSALGQTWPDVEVVVVDDGSTDDSREVLARYGDRICLRLQDNRGQASAVNAGFAVATGEVVLLLDSDDELLPDVCERAARLLGERPDVVRVQWPMVRIDAAGGPLDELVPAAPYVLPEGDLAPHVARFRTYLWNPTSAAAYRRSALEQLLPMPEDVYGLRTGPDLYLSENVVLLGRVATLAEPGTRYRVHGANNSLRRKDRPAEHARTKVREIVVGHEQTRALAARVAAAVALPDDARCAWDWAFAAYRVASLALEPQQHPIALDRRPLVALRGAWSIAVHPMYPAKAKALRVGWLLAMGLTPQPVARRVAAYGLSRRPS